MTGKRVGVDIRIEHACPAMTEAGAPEFPKVRFDTRRGVYQEIVAAAPEPALPGAVRQAWPGTKYGACTLIDQGLRVVVPGPFTPELLVFAAT